MTVRSRSLRFKAETRKVLDIVINSLYSHPDVFLRELVSNASDALDKLRFEMLTTPSLGTGRELRIDIIPDEQKRTLTIRDNGIGMTGDEMATELGTIARSSARGFMDSIGTEEKKDAPELIGQFGVGFYSVFMVADSVEVISRRTGSPETGNRWASTGHDTFTLTEEDDLPEGTSVILSLKADMDEYLEPHALRDLVRRYSDFIVYPVYLEEDGKVDTEPVNVRKPIWTRPEAEVTDAEYDEFYRRLTMDPEPPLCRLVYHAEGTTEFNSMLFLPSHRDMEMLMPDYGTGVRLYIKKVLIKEQAEELLPRYLRFMKGVVESSDLPLNISRETLQENRTVKVIRKALTGRVLGWLEDLLKEKPEKYAVFFESFGDLIKEGVYSDVPNRERLADLVMVWTTTSGDSRKSLKEIAESLPEGADRIFFLSGTDRKELAHSPYIESAGRPGAEVLLFDGPLDDFMLEALGEYRGKRLVSLMKDAGEDDLTEEEKTGRRVAAEAYAGLLEYMKDQLKGRAEDVRFSPRLRDTPCIIVVNRNDPGEMLRRMMKAMNQEMPEARRILELNPAHPVIAVLQDLYDRERSGERLKSYVGILFDLGQVMAGGRPDDPAAFGRGVAELLVQPCVREVSE